MDILEDTSHLTLYKIAKSVGLPDYVKKAEVETPVDVENHSDGLFADSFNRRFPLDSKANTWLSAAYFAKTAEDESYVPAVRAAVEDAIKQAADAYGIRKDVDEVMSKLGSKPVSVKRAADDESNYGWPSERKYPMFNEEGVKLANEYFEENAYNYPPAMRHFIAKRILSKSAEYGMQPSETVRMEAGQGMQFRDHIGAQLVDRARACEEKSAEAAMSLSRAAKQLMTLPPAHFVDQAIKFAELLERVDEAFGFDDGYRVRFEPPAQVFFGMSVKKAHDIAEDTVVLGGRAFSITKLAELPLEVFTCTLGDDFGDRVKSAEGIDVGKLSDELHSMPVPDKKALYRSILAYVD